MSQRNLYRLHFHALLCFMLSGAGLTGCGRTDAPRADGPKSDSMNLEQSVGKRVRLRGMAERRKLGPWLVSEGVSVQMLGLEEWPDQVVGQAVEVTGVLRKIHQPPPATKPLDKIVPATWSGANWFGVELETWTPGPGAKRANQ